MGQSCLHPPDRLYALGLADRLVLHMSSGNEVNECVVVQIDHGCSRRNGGQWAGKRVIPHIHDLQLLEDVDNGERTGKLVICKSKSRKSRQLSVTRRYGAARSENSWQTKRRRCFSHSG